MGDGQSDYVLWIIFVFIHFYLYSGLLISYYDLLHYNPDRVRLQQTWLLPLQPLPEEAQLWDMQKRGISLAGGHELFQLYHLLGVHSATLLPLPSLWSRWGSTKHTKQWPLRLNVAASIRNPANVSACSAPTPDMLTCDDWIRMRHSERLTLFASHTFVSTFRSRNAFQPRCTKCLYSKLHD